MGNAVTSGINGDVGGVMSAATNGIGQGIGGDVGQQVQAAGGIAGQTVNAAVEGNANGALQQAT